MRMFCALLLMACVTGQILVSQLVDPYFPDRNPSTRVLTNNKRLFKAYKGQIMLMTLVCHEVKSANLEVNGKRVEIKTQWEGGRKLGAEIIVVNITDYVHDGHDNTLSIQNILPKGAYILAYVPYPVLGYGTPESVGMSSALLQKVDELIQADVAKGFPGAALSIVKNGKIVKEAVYGYARKYTDEGKLMDKFQDMKKDAIFDMASNTKMFASIFALMKLFSSELFEYVNTIEKYMPAYTGMDRKGHNRSQILALDALSHVAGYESMYRFYDERNELYSRDKALTEANICRKLDLARNRGESVLYSDIDYMLAGFLVEHISKLELQNYVEKFIYAPLGLKRTCFNPLKKGFKKEDAAATEIFGNTRNFTVVFKDIRTTVVQGEVHDENSFYSVNGTSGHAGLFSTISDMAILCQVLLNKGGYGNVRLWDRDTQDLFTKPSDLDVTYGVGWRREGNADLNWHFGAYASNEAIGHTGWTGTVTVVDPKYDLSIVLLTNKKHSNYTGENFYGDTFETGRYGSVVQLIYESFLNR